MADVWPINLTGDDRKVVTALADRRRRLGLASEYTETIRAAVRAMLTADDETLIKGTLGK